MRILIVNYHYFIGGGPDRYFFNIADLFRGAGHTVVPFAFDYQETLATPWRRFFPEPITGPGPSLLADQRIGLPAQVRAAARMFSNPDVERRFAALVRETHPDLVYSVHLSSSLLPSIFAVARRRFNLPVFYRLSDFHLTCGSYLFHRDGAVCTECLETPLSLVRHRCMKGSLVASFLRYLQLRHNRLRGWYDAVNCFLAPSRFMADKLRQAGIEDRRIRHLPTFARDLAPAGNGSGRGHILYFGKLTPEKGVEPLLRAYNRLAPNSGLPPLVLVGRVEEGYRERLLSLPDHAHRGLVRLTGPLGGEALWDTLRAARFVVHPALWYENMPNTVLEAMSAGKAVIASNLGSLAELVADGVNGLLVPPGDDRALAQAMKQLIEPAAAEDMGREARARYLADHTPPAHFEALLGIFDEVRGRWTAR